MTTIVYDHKRKQIAVDSRSTAGGLICSDESQKWFTLGNGELWFMCGSFSDKKLFIAAFKDADNALDLEFIPDAISIVVRGGVALLRGVTESGEAWTQELENSRCIGSGSSFALSALDFGNTAEQSVKYAITRDCYTGGKVHVYDIALGKFLE
jgi:20S proteasome alpha/beta subunit